jgi:predicted amidohydrolase
MKIAAIQMVSTGILSNNLLQARALLEQAAQAGAELAVLPEYFCLIGQHDADKLAIQEDFGAGPIQQFLGDAARTLGLWLVGGTLPLSSGQPDRFTTVRWSTARRATAWRATTRSICFALTTAPSPTMNHGCWSAARSPPGLRWRRQMGTCGKWA